ncbi:unnamed protein product [Cyprideis torosa]|uniref:Uncharacterized protein n=1 Tax=Cyprideis torosa TaxID=163714 RepID=A0A7R8ZJ80_9CRUS|nr:unnamed protein product [Cyprideis torosa]CAG0881676.1 unnamed protein product [Cyprideis torosa]
MHHVKRDSGHAGADSTAASLLLCPSSVLRRVVSSVRSDLRSILRCPLRCPIASESDPMFIFIRVRDCDVILPVVSSSSVVNKNHFTMNSVKKKTFSFGKISLPSTEDASATIAQNPNDDVGEFGKFSGGKQLGRTEEVPQQTEEEDEVAAIMGFSSFSSSSIKKAKNFDLEAELKESLAIASERREKKMNKAIIEGNENKINALKEDDRATSTSRDEGDGYIGPLPPEESTTNVAEESDDEEIGPPLPPSFSAASTSEDKDSDEEGSSENEEEIVLNHGAKAVSSLALDPSGARLISGGIDYEVKFWDFAGMDAALQSFRTIKPCESHPIKHLSYSTTGEHVLVVSGSAQAKVLDRDGFEVMECVKGMYVYVCLSDMFYRLLHIV